MAKAKTTTTDLDKRLQSIDELIETNDSLITKFQASSSLSPEAISEFKEQWASLRKLKDSLGQDAPLESRKRVDQAIEKLRSFVKEKLKPSPVSESNKAKTLESLDEVLENLNDKLEELKAQAEGGSKRKGKNQNKNDKPDKWIENLSYHISRLEGIKNQYITEATVDQDQTLQEIISYFQDYLSNAEYQQQSQDSFIDGLYESFEKPDEPLNHSFLDEEIEISSPGSRVAPREEGKQNTIVTTGAEDQNMGDKLSFMNRMRETGFEHETRQMPNVSDKEVKGEYNFFDVFEASAKNIPQETDYYPNASTKERVSTKNIYPKRKLVGEHMFERFDVDTLFFIFYFQKDTYEQSLAAKELKKRAWRFHKKYLTWFKRLEPPRVTNEDYEQGTYAFFDFEPGGWCQRRKSDFTFKYSYLEDDKMCKNELERERSLK